MLDIRFIRENAEAVQQNAHNKAYTVSIAELLEKDTRVRELKTKAEELRGMRNTIAAGMKNGKPSPELIEKGKAIKAELAAVEEPLKVLELEFMQLLKSVPNMADADVPVGLSEDENVVIKQIGHPTEFAFTPKNHADIANTKNWLDKDRASKVAGARFAYVKGDLVRLQMAIIAWVFDVLGDTGTLKNIATDAGITFSGEAFTPVLPPYMIRTEQYDAMDRLEPRDDRYQIAGEELWLQGSAEHVLGSMHADETFSESELPKRYIGYATSFRKEAGTYGKDMEGLFRMHQFDKLEMESFTTKDDGHNEHLLFVAIQEYLVKTLELPYQVLQKCTFDIGKPNARGVDTEVWLPGQGKYRETHTADYMTDYQARRLNTRVRRTSGDLELIHTNDATAFALGRIMIAIIENYQTEHGNVRIPEVLKKYLGGREEL